MRPQVSRAVQTFIHSPRRYSLYKERMIEKDITTDRIIPIYLRDRQKKKTVQQLDLPQTVLNYAIHVEIRIST